MSTDIPIASTSTTYHAPVPVHLNGAAFVDGGEEHSWQRQGWRHRPQSAASALSSRSTPVSSSTPFSNATPSSSNSSVLDDELEGFPTRLIDGDLMEKLAGGVYLDTARSTHHHAAYLMQRAEQARQEFMHRTGRFPPPPLQQQQPNFNPCATEFVPAAVRGRGNRADTPAARKTPTSPTFVPPRPSTAQARSSASPFPVKHPWMSTFRTASATSDRNVRRAQAATIVNLGPWDEPTIAELAEKFSDRVMQGYTTELVNVAPLARELHDGFRNELSEECAALFQRALSERLWTDFQALWHSDSSGAIRRSLPGHPRTSVLLSSGLAIAFFVAQLFVEGLIASNFVYNCLHTLVAKMSVLEEVHAVHLLVANADVRLYDTRCVPLFMDALTRASAAIPDDASVVGSVFDQAQVQQLVKETYDIVDAWGELTRASPDTSVGTALSDSSSEYTIDDVTPVTPPEATPRALALNKPEPPALVLPSTFRYSDVVKNAAA